MSLTHRVNLASVNSAPVNLEPTDLAPRGLHDGCAQPSRLARAGGSRGGWVYWLGTASLVASLCLAAGPAYAADEGDQAAKLEQAVKQVEQLSYQEAQQLLFDVVRSGQATSEQLAQAYFNLGIVEAALDNEVESTDSFYLALMLQPALLFPEGGSPKIRARLNEARSRVTEVGVLEARASVKSGVLEVHLDNDPLKLVRRIEVLMTRGDGDSGKVELKKNDLRAEVEPGVKTIQVVLYDEAGNQLKVVDVDPTEKPGVGAASSVPASASVWQSWGLWAGVAGALALGGGYFIMESGNINDDIDEARREPAPDVEIARLEDERDRVGTYGVIGLSMAGAAAVTAGALLIFGGDRDAADASKETSTEASLVPSLGRRQVGARFSLRF
jgi:hypothetical protein